MASRTERNKPGRELPTTPETTGTAGAHRTPAHIHRVRAGQVSRGVTTPVPRVYLSVSLTRPDPSGSPEPTRLCRGCSHLPRRSPDRLPPASPHRHDGRAPKVSHLHPPQQHLVAHAAVFDLLSGARVGGCGRRARHRLFPSGPRQDPASTDLGRAPQRVRGGMKPLTDRPDSGSWCGAARPVSRCARLCGMHTIGPPSW